MGKARIATGVFLVTLVTGATAKSDGGRGDAPLLKGAFLRGAALQLGHASGFFLAAQSLLLACAQFIFRGPGWGGLRAIGFELDQLQIHAQLLEAAIPRRQFILEALLRGLA